MEGATAAEFVEPAGAAFVSDTEQPRGDEQAGLVDGDWQQLNCSSGYCETSNDSISFEGANEPPWQPDPALGLSAIESTDDIEDSLLALGATDAAEDAELVSLQPGQMRLQGSFQGVATTHSHQLDLSVGLDVEMPSAVAAEAIRQIHRRSRSSSPGKRSRLASTSPEDERTVELPDKQRTLWSTLADFFRKDARRGPAIPPMGLPDLQLKLEDSSSFREQAERLTQDLQSSQCRASQLEGKLLELMEERDGLHSRLQHMMQEMTEQATHIDALREQGERCRVGGEQLSQELSQKEEEVRTLQASLTNALQTVDALNADLTKEQLAKDRLESSLSAARRSHEMMVEENGVLRVNAARATSTAEELQARLDGLEQTQEEKGQLALQLQATGEERQKLADRLAVLERERSELRTALCQAEAHQSEAAQAASLQQEVLSLRQQAKGLQAELDQVRTCQTRAAPPVAPTTTMPQDVLERLEGLERHNQILVLAKEELQAEIAQHMEAKAEAMMQAAQLRGQLAQAELATEQLRDDNAHEAAAAAAAGSVAELDTLRAQLATITAENSSVIAELERARAEASAQDRAAVAARTLQLDALRQAADAQARILELETQHGDSQAKAGEQTQDLQRRLAAAAKEAADAELKASKALEERDLARQQLREERSVGLESSARVQDELHSSRQKELQSTVRCQNLDEELSKLRESHAELEERLLAAESAVESAACEPPILLQDPSHGNCLIRTLPAAAFASPVPSSHRIVSVGARRARSSAPAFVTALGGLHASSPVSSTAGMPLSPRVVGLNATSPTLVYRSMPTSPPSPTSPTSPVLSRTAPVLHPPHSVTIQPAAAMAPVLVPAVPVTTVTTAVPHPSHVPAPLKTSQTVMPPFVRTVGRPQQHVAGTVNLQILGVRRVR